MEEKGCSQATIDWALPATFGFGLACFPPRVRMIDMIRSPFLRRTTPRPSVLKARPACGNPRNSTAVSRRSAVNPVALKE